MAELTFGTCNYLFIKYIINSCSFVSLKGFNRSLQFIFCKWYIKFFTCSCVVGYIVIIVNKVINTIIVIICIVTSYENLKII